MLWRPAIGPALAQLMTREQPETPDGWTPKMRTRKNGVWTNEPWGAAIR